MMTPIGVALTYACLFAVTGGLVAYLLLNVHEGRGGR